MHFVGEVIISTLAEETIKIQGSKRVDSDELYFWGEGFLRASLGLELLQNQPHPAPFSHFPLDGQWKSSIQCIFEMNSLFSGKAGLSKAKYTPSNLLVDLDVVKDLSSGVSKYRDFIRSLPVHLSKYILSMLGCTGEFLQTPRITGWLGGSQVHVFFFFSGMLDKNSLNRCASVSQHWAMLVQQVKMELSMHPFIQSHITFLQVLPVWRGRGRSGDPPHFRIEVPLPGGLSGHFPRSSVGLLPRVCCFVGFSSDFLCVCSPR